MSAYRRDFNETKYISFLINDDNEKTIKRL